MTYTTRRLARKTNWATITPAEGQIVYDKTKKSARIGDGSTVAGRALAFDNRSQIITPNQLGGNTNDYAPAGLLNAGLMILSADADRDLTGIDISQFPDGVADRIISIAVESSSPGAITIKDASSSSSASNRFLIGRDLRLTPGSVQLFRYRAGAINRWCWFGTPAVALTYNPTETLRVGDIQAALDNLQRRCPPVISVGLNTPPASPATGDAYVVGTSPTGAWASNAKALAVCSNATGPVWAFVTPTNDQSMVYNRADGSHYRYTASAWSAIGSGINDGQITAVKLDTSTATKKSEFRAAVLGAPVEALAGLNLAINPAMEVSQEVGTTAVTLTATSSLQTRYLVDGVMAHYRGSFVAAGQQVSSPFAGTRYALRLTVSVAQASMGTNDELSVVLPIEGTRCARLAMGTSNAAPQSLGFWIQANRTGTYSGSIRNGAKNRSRPFSFTITTANTPQWVSLTNIAGDTSGTWANDVNVGQYITICLAGGASRIGTDGAWAGADYSGATGTTNGVAATSDVFHVSNVIALPGVELPDSARAAFVNLPFDEALARCQRYWETSTDGTPANGNGSDLNRTSGGAVFSSAIYSDVIRLRVKKRAIPTMTFYSTNLGSSGAGVWQYYGPGGWTDSSATAVLDVSSQAFAAVLTVSGLNIQPYIIAGNWSANARLS